MFFNSFPSGRSDSTSDWRKSMELEKFTRIKVSRIIHYYVDSNKIGNNTHCKDLFLTFRVISRGSDKKWSRIGNKLIEFSLHFPERNVTLNFGLVLEKNIFIFHYTFRNIGGVRPECKKLYTFF